MTETVGAVTNDVQLAVLAERISAIPEKMTALEERVLARMEAHELRFSARVEALESTVIKHIEQAQKDTDFIKGKLDDHDEFVRKFRVGVMLIATLGAVTLWAAGLFEKVWKFFH